VSDFAIVDDVAIRWRPLSSTEAATVSALICDASSMIRNRWSDIDDRIAAGTLPEQEATRVVANMVRRAMLNRDGEGVASRSETVGGVTESATYVNPTGSLYLSADDVRVLGPFVPRAKNGWLA
jgi:hypothetical protein